MSNNCCCAFVFQVLCQESFIRDHLVSREEHFSKLKEVEVPKKQVFPPSPLIIIIFLLLLLLLLIYNFIFKFFGGGEGA